MSQDYKSTIRLPKTDFSMKADLPKREPLFLEKWKAQDIYAKLLKAREGRPSFVLHCGPPFANGDAHMGHALNVTLKDIVLKSRNMLDFSVPFIPGWDCHGLPIEHKVMKDLGGAQNLDPVVVREKCEAMARKYIGIQREQFQRLGVFGDWENPYATLDPQYEADILRVFAGLVAKNLVYQALRPVHWSTGCQTALAEAEIEYQQKTDLAVYVKFPLSEASVQKLGVPAGTALLIWTTTPWTLPANLAVAVSDRLRYVLRAKDGQHVLVAESLSEKIPQMGGAETVKGFEGSALVGLTYHHPFIERTGQVYAGDFVTADAGTGLVHIAPGHGADDYQLGKQQGLAPFSPVDDRGCLTAECGVPSLVGQYVFKANPLVRDLLRERGLLWFDEEFQHDYPHCWRSKTPIIFRSVPQWFIQVDAFRQQALDEIKNVKWIPAWGESRISGAVASRPDWCISRQRTWGVPLPIFYQADGTALLDKAVIEKAAQIVEQRGTNWWFATPTDDLAKELGLPAGLRKGTDTLDVWIDSGSSHAAVTRRRLTFPADLYLEGSDQHRGWFQSSLLTSVALTGEAPYKSVLTNGFVVDVDGKKLSKSATYSKPTDLMTFVNTMGADVLRLWVAHEDYTDDVPFSDEIFKRVSDTYRSIRNTLRVLLGNLHDFDPAQHSVPSAQWPELDQYVYLKLTELVKQSVAAYDAYAFHTVYHAVNRFCAVELSALYVDVTKDRLYCDPENSVARRSTQTVMRLVVDTLVRLLAPITPFTAEEAWEFLGEKESVHLQLFPSLPALDVSADFLTRWEKLLAVRGRVNEQLEKARQTKKIGKSLEATVVLPEADTGLVTDDVFAELLIVSQVKRGAELTVGKSSEAKCVRCWKFLPSVGSVAAHPELCARCASAV